MIGAGIPLDAERSPPISSQHFGSVRAAHLRLLACAGLAMTIGSMAPAADGADKAKQQPAGIPGAQEPMPAPKGIPGAEQPAAPGSRPANRPASGAGAKPPAGGTKTPPPGTSGKSGAEIERAEGRVVDGKFRFGPYAEGVKVQFLIDSILDFAKIPNVIITDKSITEKEVVLTQEIVLPVDKLVDFLIVLLEQNNATLVKEGELHFIENRTDLSPNIENHKLATTQIIPTRGLRPSSLQQAIQIALRGGAGGGGGGAVTPPGAGGGGGGAGGGGGSIAFLDDLGAILMTDSPRRIAQVTRMVNLLVQEQEKQDINRIDVKHISAASARQRLLELLGRPQGGGAGGRDLQSQVQAQALAQAQGLQGGGLAGSQALSNIADRLVPDTKSNVLIFRGREDETAFIRKLLAVVDTPNQLKGKFYPAGLFSEQLATLGRNEGLGEIVTLSSANNNRRGGGANPFGGLDLANQGLPANLFGGNAGAQTAPGVGGPIFVIDPDQRGFMYFGTDEQHARVAELSKSFSEFSSRTEIVFEYYKLKHARAEDAAEIIRGLINNQVPSGSLLGRNSRDRFDRGGSGGLGGSGSDRNSRNNNRRTSGANAGTFGSNSGGSGAGSLAGLTSDPAALNAADDVFVLPDVPNNQIIVKAPKPLQAQFAKLIGKLDLRRPQVYLDAKIVAISATDSMRLAVETQLINAAGTGGVVHTNFGLGSLPAAAAGTQPLLGTKSVSGTLSGLTAAIIKSDQVPIILRAIANAGDTQLLATPQLLVDDNETAEVSSLDQRPTTTTSIGSAGQQNTTTFAGFEPAGPRLTVTPRISEGNYLHLEYDIELSSFNGDPPVQGVPPPKQENRINSIVSVPSDSTIVVGGLVFEQKDNTVIKIPLLGDIPIIGQLFRDETWSTSNRVLYVFITPRIMRDPSFADLRLLTRGPSDSIPDRLREDLPETLPASINISPAGQVPSGQPTTSAPTAPASTTPAANPPLETVPIESVNPPPPALPPAQPVAPAPAQPNTTGGR